MADYNKDTTRTEEDSSMGNQSAQQGGTGNDTSSGSQGTGQGRGVSGSSKRETETRQQTGMR